MKRLLAIVYRDVSSAFGSPIAYVVMAAFALVTGFMFLTVLADYQFYSQQLLAQSVGMPNADEILAQISVVDSVLAPYFGNAAVIFLLMTPVLTMRLLSEEKKTGTDELLFTAPLNVHQIVLGKFLAGVVLLSAVLSTTLIPVASLFVFGNPPLKVVLASYLGMLLLVSMFVSIGLFASSLTENQIVAAVVGFAMLLFLYIIGWPAMLLGESSAAGRLLNHLWVPFHFEDFTRGIIGTVHVVYFLSMTFIGLFFTARVVESQRWR